MTLDELVATFADAVAARLKAPAADEDRWFSIAAAAKHAEVSPSWLRTQVAAGLIPHGRAGRELRIRQSDLDAFIMTARPAQQDGPGKSPREIADELNVRRRRRNGA